MPNITGAAAAGFQDASLWEKSKGNPETIRRLIREGLQNTSVTVVLVTHGVSQRTYINYEIEKSLERGNGLVGVHIHHLNDPNSNEVRVGLTPSQIEANGFKSYKYTDKIALARYIEEAARIAGK